MSREPIPEVLVELLALGELEEADAELVRARLGPGQDEALRALARSDAEVLGAYPPAIVAAELRAELAPKVVPLAHRNGRRWAAFVGGMSVAAAVALTWWLSSRDAAAPEASDLGPIARAPSVDVDGGVRHKGGSRLIVHRRGDETPLTDGQEVAPGDELQLSYVAGGRRYGAIVSVDGAGAATLHWPETETGDPTLVQGVVQLEYAFELDDAPGFERFFFVTAPEPFSVSTVVEATRGFAAGESVVDGALPIPKTWEQVSILLRKRSVAEAQRPADEHSL